MLVGKCWCGAVQYAVEGPFLYAGYCHCSRCRAASGSAFSAFAGIEKDKLRVTHGEDSITLFERGPDNSRCKLCGSPLFALVRDGRFFHVRMGTLLDDPGISPDVPHLRRLEGAVARDDRFAPAICRASACGGDLTLGRRVGVTASTQRRN